MPAPFSIIRDTDPSPPRGGVIAIGNFDGVHLGHRTVIDAAIAMAKANGSAAYAVTFEPHPRSFFQPNVPQFRLSSERDKLRLLAAHGTRRCGGDGLRRQARGHERGGVHHQ